VKSLQRTLQEYTIHYYQERSHPGKDNCLLFPSRKADSNDFDSEIQCRSRLGGVLNYYHKEAACELRMRNLGNIHC